MTAIKPPEVKTLPDRVVHVPRAEVPALPGGLDGPPVPSTVELPLKGKTRTDFRGEEFRRTIAQHGKYVTWRKALICPCFIEDTQQADINCTSCDGSGFYYIDPIAIQAHMVQFDKSTRIHEKFGMWLEGQCSVTTLPEHRLGFRDSIEMRDSVMNFTEVLKKGNRRGIRSGLPTNIDTARYRVERMTRMVAKVGAAIVLLEEDVDFEITNDGWIKWFAPGNAKIPNGTILSVRYEFHPVWIVVSFPHSMRDDATGFKQPPGVDKIDAHPIQAAAKLDFLLDVNNTRHAVTPVLGPSQ